MSEVNDMQPSGASPQMNPLRWLVFPTVRKTVTFMESPEVLAHRHMLGKSHIAALH